MKTTEEQQEAKRKEREKKLKLYTAGTQKVFEKVSLFKDMKNAQYFNHSVSSMEMFAVALILKESNILKNSEL